MFDDTVSTDDDQKPWQFKPGQSSNPAGRPKGSRNALGEAFIAALLADWQEHGASAIERVRVEKPEQYLKVIASILRSHPVRLSITHKWSRSRFALAHRN